MHARRGGGCGREKNILGFNHNSKIVECDSISFHAPEREREREEAKLERVLFS